jgi:deoxyribose-phosphate aldolase
VDTQERDLRLRCLEAEKYRIPVVVVNPVNVRLTKYLCQGLDVDVATVISYPVGAYFPEVKAQEIEDAIDDGADQIYMVMAVGAFLDGLLEVQTIPEIKYLAERTSGRPSKLVTEISILSQDQRRRVCDMAMEQGVDYLVTTTDFDRSHLPPVTMDDLHSLVEHVRDDLKLIHKSGFPDPAEALACLDAGIARICTENARAVLQVFDDFPWT